MSNPNESLPPVVASEPIKITKKQKATLEALLIMAKLEYMDSMMKMEHGFRVAQADALKTALAQRD